MALKHKIDKGCYIRLARRTDRKLYLTYQKVHTLNTLSTDVIRCLQSDLEVHCKSLICNKQKMQFVSLFLNLCYFLDLLLDYSVAQRLHIYPPVAQKLAFLHS
jgi:hypothetical protein